MTTPSSPPPSEHPADSPHASPSLTDSLRASDPALAETARVLSDVDFSSPSYFTGALRAFDKKIVEFVRQSSNRQVKRHRYSFDVQTETLRHFHGAEDRIIRLHALGESGAGEAERETFEQLLTLLESGEVGVVVIARHDRLGRNDRDHVRCMEVMARRGVMLMVDGHLFDPSNHDDKLILGIYSTFAEYENKLRTRWMRLTALASARRLSLRIPLPVPLLWASPDDPDYVRALDEAGLADWLLDLPAEGTPGKVCSRQMGKRLYPLPFPDRDVVLAAELILRWIIAEGSVRAAVARTMTDPAWPAGHAGEFPSLRTHRYVHGETEVTWLPIEVSLVAAWAKVEALGGVYSFKSRMRDTRALTPQASDLTVRVEDAFRSMISTSEAAELQEVLRLTLRDRPDRPRRPYALPSISCNHPMSDDAVCGARLFPMAHPSSGHAYAADECILRGHTSGVGSYVDGVVLQTVSEVLTPDVLRVHVDESLLSANDDAQARERLQNAVTVARGRMSKAADKEMAAADAGMEVMEGLWHGKVEEQAVVVANLERQLRTLEERAASRGDLRGDAARIAGLAEDLQGLLARVGAHPELAHRLLRALGVHVNVHSPGKYAYSVEVIFPTGQRVHRWLFSQPMPCAQAARVYCALQLQQGSAADDVAAEVRPFFLRNEQGSWTARRVHGAALAHQHAETESMRAGLALSLPALANQVACSATSVLRAAILGQLGPATVVDGMLALAPTDAELHVAFPSYARAEIARNVGASPEDVATVSDAAHRLWQPVAPLFDRIDHNAAYFRGVDLAGRVYVRLAEHERPHVLTAVAANFAARPELPALDATGWRLATDLRPHPCRAAVLALAPSMELPHTDPRRGAPRRWVWTGASVLRDVAAAHLAEVVARSAHHALPADDFHPAELAFHRLVRQYGSVTRFEWRVALRRRTHALPAVSAYREFDGVLRLVEHVHIPAAILTGSDPAALKEFLRGAPVVPRKKSRGRELKRARIAREVELAAAAAADALAVQQAAADHDAAA